MSETVLSIEALTLPGEDVSVTTVQSFGRGTAGAGVAGLKVLTIVRGIDDLSAGLVLLHQSGEPRAATLTCTDDAGGIRLKLQLSKSRVTSYVANGGLDATPIEPSPSRRPLIARHDALGTSA